MTSLNTSDWLNKWVKANSPAELAKLFAPDGFWRDYLSFDWDLQTAEGTDDIERFSGKIFPKFSKLTALVAGETSENQIHFTFETRHGSCRGLAKLENGRCHSLFTCLQSLPQKSETLLGETKSDPYVLIVGGGQSGLALGAHLQQAGVPYLIVDQNPRVGDCWRNRYDSLVLHDPVWVNHMPFKPFPEDWPVFTPKDMMADWLETYAQDLKVNIQTGTRCVSAKFIEDQKCWAVDVEDNGVTTRLHPQHLVMAVGTSGFAKTPEFPGADLFAGQQLHSSQFVNGENFSGQSVVVVGANNSAHDIAASLVKAGAKPTLIQRSSTHVVRQKTYIKNILGALYGPDSNQSVEEADFLMGSTPMRTMEQNHIRMWKGLKETEAEFYDLLSTQGFNLDFAEDGAGLAAKYRRTASGYYIDVGASQMVADGRIAVKSGVEIKQLEPTSVRLSSGEKLPADAIVYATGFGSMEDWVAKLIDPQTAKKIGRCWGYGSGFKGDEGPWEGELRNMWKPTAQDGLWFMGGNLAQVRYFSYLLALQLEANLNFP